MSTFNLNVLIVEDSLSFALELEMLLIEIGYIVMGKIDNSEDAIAFINAQQPDLVLMDIDIKGNKTGLDVATAIKPLDIPVLFITSFEQEKYYQKAQQTNLIGYLIKPVRKFSLRSAIEMAFRKIGNAEQEENQKGFFHREFLFLKKGRILHKIKLNDINFVKADDDYSIIYTDDAEFISSLRISEMENMLPKDVFFRTHRSYIVNVRRVDAVDTVKNELKVNTHEVPISRSKKQIFLQKIDWVK